MYLMTSTAWLFNDYPRVTNIH